VHRIRFAASRLLGGVLVLSLAACGSGESDRAQSSSSRESSPAAASTASLDGQSDKAAARESARTNRTWEVPESAPGGAPYEPALREELSRTLAEKPEGYVPRTDHLRSDGSPLFTNRLVRESSPYLLQHAHNPVDWHAWGDEAFEKARALERPVLLSVGYSTCHWCHVMERESFEDLEIATYINEHYVAIKVDREERPDVDETYMGVVQLLTGGGGWPMTVILTPQRQPLFAGTYFPARDGDRGAGTGFLTILTQIRARYAAEGAVMASEAAVTTRRLQALAAPAPPGDLPDAAVIARAVADFSNAFDTVFGGFGGAPKFPRPVTLELLLRYHRRTGDADALHMAVYTLERMAAGGIHDHVGGGFHRYATDARWRVPHFEKMLYDNAALAIAYLEAHQATGRADFAEVAAEILDYVAREMTDDSGGFYSATDADSPRPDGEDEEGLYFTWTPAEIRAVLEGKDADLALEVYGVTGAGNFEGGRSILHIAKGIDTAAVQLGLGFNDARRRLNTARPALLRARSNRAPPLTDTKILAGWNGLMISAFARGALVLGNSIYEGRARVAAELIATRLVTPEGKLRRVWIDGVARHDAVLEDYAYVIAGLLDLFEVRAEARWLELAIALQARLDADFADERGGYFLTARDAEKLLVRGKPDADGALPSGNAVAILNLLRLAELTGREEYRKSAERGFRAFGRAARMRPTSMPKMLVALDYYLDAPKEVVIVAPDGETDVSPFIDALSDLYLPNRTLVAVSAGPHARRIGELVPLARDKTAIGGEPTAYLCEKRVCKKPTTDPAELARQAASVVTPYSR
jgi:uncharacterized protein YyaL (SSP411 family)